MNRQPEQTKITALYERLSREDALAGESLSIQHQKQILEEYAAKNGFTNTRHFFDDGTTGVHFDRNGWKQLITEVETGNVSTCIIMDMTRFGRDHVQVGAYMDADVKHRLKK